MRPWSLALVKKTVQFCDLDKTEHTSKECKAYYCKALRAVKQEHKCLGAKPAYRANSVITVSNAKEAAEQKAWDDIADKMSGSFNVLASAAVAKAETIDSHAATIAALTKTNTGDKQTSGGATYRRQTALLSAGLPVQRSCGPHQPIRKQTGRWHA